MPRLIAAIVVATAVLAAGWTAEAHPVRPVERSTDQTLVTAQDAFPDEPRQVSRGTISPTAASASPLAVAGAFLALAALLAVVGSAPGAGARPRPHHPGPHLRERRPLGPSPRIVRGIEMRGGRRRHAHPGHRWRAGDRAGGVGLRRRHVHHCRTRSARRAAVARLARSSTTLHPDQLGTPGEGSRPSSRDAVSLNPSPHTRSAPAKPLRSSISRRTPWRHGPIRRPGAETHDARSSSRGGCAMLWRLLAALALLVSPWGRWAPDLQRWSSRSPRPAPEFSLRTAGGSEFRLAARGAGWW